MRVLMLGWEFPPHIAGGLGTACEGIAHALVADGVDVTFVLPRLYGDEPARGVSLVEASPARPGLSTAAVDSALRPYQSAVTYETQRPPDAEAARDGAAYGNDLFSEVARYAERVCEVAVTAAEAAPFDVVHAHDWMTFPAGAAAARALGVPLVVHVHSCEFDRSGHDADPRIVALEQQGLDDARAVVCVSRYTAARLRDRYVVAEPRLRVVHNAAPRYAAPAPAARAVDDPIVLFLGRVTYQKGPAYFLEAAARVAQVEPTTKFVVAGDGDLLPSMIERAAALGLARRVHFTRFLSGEAVSRMYRHADVYVMPSVSEPFGIAPLEAVAHGVPVIVSRQSGVAEVLPSALRADFWDVEDLANKILAVLRRPALGRALAAGARVEAAELRWELAATALGGIYEELAG